MDEPQPGDSPEPRASYFQPRVMRYVREDGTVEYAIHEVYFTEQDEVWGFTDDALSPREPSVTGLREALTRLLAGDQEEVTTGDLGYTYARCDIEEWLERIDDPPIDYRSTSPDPDSV